MSRVRQARKFRVALAIETSSIYGRRLLEGITRYLRLHTDWTIVLEQRSLTDRPPGWLKSWNGDGIISRATTRRIADELLASKLPVIELTDRHGDFGLVHVWSDDHAIGALGASHFLDRGFQNFAFCGFEREAWSSKRLEGFRARLAGKSIEVYETLWEELAPNFLELEETRLTQWLLKLPRPLALFCCNDVRAQQVLNACQIANLLVPEEVAVLGVDDDALLCELCRPTLSSVVPNPTAIGYQAAELLDQWMQGREPVDRQYLVSPQGITLRQSTDVIAVEDPVLAAALQIIREHACSGVTIQEVLNQLNVSRSALERKFRKIIQHSPQTELRMVQLKRVKQLLVDTELPLTQIATMTGFEHPEYLNVIFKRMEKLTPGEYRKSQRAERRKESLG